MPRSRRAGPSLVGVLAGGALLVCAGKAAAFCREVTASPPSNYDPRGNGCYGTTLPPLFWRNECVSYSLQRDASRQISLEDASNVADQAFSAWMNASCPGGGAPSITPSRDPAVSCDMAPSTGHNNPIIFRDDTWPHPDPANTLGYTTLTVNLVTGEILGAVIEINSANVQIVTAPPIPQGAYSLASILTHEAGHFLGLAHSQDPTAIMYAYYTNGMSAIAPDDVTGICTIYPPDGTRLTATGASPAASCDPEPPNGFLEECGSADAGRPNDGGSEASTPDPDAGPVMPCSPPPRCSAAPSGDREDGALPGRLAMWGVLGLTGWRRRRRRSSRSRHPTHKAD